MALTFIPSDLIEQAAREENWTDSDRQRCSRMLRQAFEDSRRCRAGQVRAMQVSAVARGGRAVPAPWRSSPSVCCAAFVHRWSVSRFRQSATATQFDAGSANDCLPRPCVGLARLSILGYSRGSRSRHAC
jgi:hypothetical protein